MLMYDVSHVASGPRRLPARSRHGIAREHYAEHKAAIVLREGALRRRTDRLRRVKALWSAVYHSARRAAQVIQKVRPVEVSDQR